MTKRSQQKFREYSVNWLLIPWIAGVIEALLLARLVARLLAGRPDNPSLELLYAVTAPIVAPLQALNYDQPPFGAALDYATLVLAILVPGCAYLAWRLLHRPATTGDLPPS